MSVTHSAIIAVGKEFTSEDAAVEFIKEAGLLTEDLQNEIDTDGLQECHPYGMTFQSLDLYAGDYFYLGFPLRGNDVERFRASLDTAIDAWNAFFPNSPALVINTVRYT